MAKGFDSFCPVSAYLNRNALYNHQEVDMWLKVNGQLRQKGNTRDMIFNIDELIARISRVMLLQPGDMILTG